MNVITVPNFIFMMSYLTVSVGGLTLLKISDGRLFSIYGMVGVLLYGLGFLLWYLILSRISLSVAFPIAAGGLVILTQLSGYFLLKETISLSHLIGVILIMLGITVVAYGNPQL